MLQEEKMRKNITFSADDELIKKARERARKEHATLNERFRSWIKRYSSEESAEQNYRALMNDLKYAQTEKTFTREEMNER